MLSGTGVQKRARERYVGRVPPGEFGLLVDPMMEDA